MNTTAQPLLEVSDLAVHFAGRGGLLRARSPTVQAVDGVSFRMWRGETLGLVGESGCGKSTVGRAIVGLVRADRGTIRFDGKPLGALRGAALRRERRRMTMVFQDPYSSLDPRMRVRTIVREPLDAYRVGSTVERDARVAELLKLVGLPVEAAERYPAQFSGGQRQRIGIARALALSPELVVADEAISALDVSIQAQIINLLRRLQREFGLTYLFIAHDLAAVRYISDRVMVMYLGRVMELAPARVLYRRPLHPYTVSLLSAVPVPDPIVESTRQRIILEGEIPSSARPPGGCRFHTRCWLRASLGSPAECVDRVPVLVEQGEGHAVACHFADRVADTPEQIQATRASTAAVDEETRPRD